MESSIAPAIVFLDSSWAFLNRHIRRQRPRDVTAGFQEISGTSSLGDFGRHLHCNVTAGFRGINRAFHKRRSKRYPPCDVTAAMISPEVSPPSSKGT
ncbi:hypothetical protein CFIO01_03596 [Colletotrichum fioriniae PJ7]|uniref:Uncharacterized protein n=1 Tax=Colletotrichum fioriniae PJ7 TaxID=1445577 RepID=A0A010RV98_9PEZI|nr:hypothetical protein CFIO01_03596 [Colletotrichum fioriniae PJ7]